MLLSLILNIDSSGGTHPLIFKVAMTSSLAL